MLRVTYIYFVGIGCMPSDVDMWYLISSLNVSVLMNISSTQPNKIPKRYSTETLITTNVETDVHQMITGLIGNLHGHMQMLFTSAAMNINSTLTTGQLF